MNIYDFIFCFFYRFWQKRDGDGAFSGVLHVIIVIFLHILFLCEITLQITGVNLFKFFASEIPGRTKFYGAIILLLIAITVWPFYRRERTKKLLKEYHQKYGEAGRKNTYKILLYVVAPTILAVTLAVIRQNM